MPFGEIHVVDERNASSMMYTVAYAASQRCASVTGSAAIQATLSANVRETRSTQRIRVGRRQRKRTCWDCEREWKRM